MDRAINAPPFPQKTNQTKKSQKQEQIFKAAFKNYQFRDFWGYL